MRERREISRTRISAPGRILARDVDRPVDCTVQDITNTGIRLEVSRFETLRADFEFSFDNFHTTRQCRLIWLRDNVAGAAFLKTSTQQGREGISEIHNCLAPPLAPDD